MVTAELPLAGIRFITPFEWFMDTNHKRVRGRQNICENLLTPARNDRIRVLSVRDISKYLVKSKHQPFGRLIREWKYER